MIIWDADGVLVDSRAVAWWVAENILGLFGSRTTLNSHAEYRQHFGRDAQRELVGEDGIEILRALHRLLMRHYRQRVTTHDDVLSIVPRISVPSVILTSSLADGLRDVLGSRTKLFTEILGREAGPKQQLLQRFAEQRPVFYVTDTITDIARCRAVGVNVCAVTWGYDTREMLLSAGPDHIVASPTELTELLGGMGLLTTEVA